MLKSLKCLDNIINVYRTKNYIIKQKLILKESFNDVVLTSCDTFYYRNKKRDKKYENCYKTRKFLEGRRIHCNVQIKHYVK